MKSTTCKGTEDTPLLGHAFVLFCDQSTHEQGAYPKLYLSKQTFRTVIYMTANFY